LRGGSPPLCPTFPCTRPFSNRLGGVAQVTSRCRLLENLEASGVAQPLLLVLDGVTDPHNLGACLRVADGAGAHAVIAPKDHGAEIGRAHV